jgi:hypothetical protein
VDFYHNGSGAWDKLGDSGSLAFSGVGGQTTINLESSFPNNGSSYTDDLIDFVVGLGGDDVNANNFHLVNAPSNSQLEILTNGSIGELALVVNGGGNPEVMMGSRLQGVPEPSTLALLGMGAIGLLMYAWRKRRT